MTKDESDKALMNSNKDLLVNSNTDLLVENIRPRKTTPVKTKARLYTFIIVDLCYISKNIKISINVLNEKPIKTVKLLK
jgi:hypothetical protein